MSATNEIEQLSAWELFKRAIKGDTEIDYTSGSIARVTFLLAVPMILEMSMESIFAVVDIFFVSQLGTDAVAVVGLTESVITLLFAVAIGLSMGTTALVARRIGEQNAAGAAEAAGQAIWLGLFISVLVGGTGWYFAQDILEMMGAEASVIEGGLTYTKIMYGGSFSIVFLFLLNAIFRGAGDASRAMWALILANSINIVLDPCLIFGVGPFPELGVTGAAVATNIGRTVGILYALYYLCQDSGRIRLMWSQLKPKFALIGQICQISGGGVFQFLVETASWIFLMRFVSEFGGEAVAGYTIAVRIVMFVILPAFGLSNAVATLVGQNLGAGSPERAEESTWAVVKYSTVYMGAISVLLILFARPTVTLFIDNATAVDYAVSCLYYFSAGLLFLGAGFSLMQAFNGAGDTYTPTWINIFAFWLVQVPLAYLLVFDSATKPSFLTSQWPWVESVMDSFLLLGFGLGVVGVFIAVLVADITAAIVSILVFRRGSWKTREV